MISPFAKPLASAAVIFGLITKVEYGRKGDFSNFASAFTVERLRDLSVTVAPSRFWSVMKLHFENKNILGQYPAGGQEIKFFLNQTESFLFNFSEGSTIQ